MSETGIWMPLYIGDYLADTQRLSAEQHGAYLLLIMDYWRNGPPPMDDTVLAQITRLERAAWRRHRAVLLGFFSEVQGWLVHKRIEQELANALERKTALSTRGAKGAKARWSREGSGDVSGEASGNTCGNASGNAQAWSRDAASSTAGMAEALPGQCTSPTPSPTPPPLYQPSVSRPPFARRSGKEALSGKRQMQAPGSVPDPTHDDVKSLDSVNAFISLPSNNGKMFHVDPAYVERLQQQFPALDVQQQFRQMQAWFEGNRRNRKTMQGMTRFIINWLSRAQDRAPRKVVEQVSRLDENDIM